MMEGIQAQNVLDHLKLSLQVKLKEKSTRAMLRDNPAISILNHAVVNVSGINTIFLS